MQHASACLLPVQTVNTGSLKWATTLVLSYLYMVMSWGCAHIRKQLVTCA